jgi:diguanylate cyclase (GGDEF)-like protein/PAS domain S-box-containing protein
LSETQIELTRIDEDRRVAETERKQAEEALINSESRLHTLIQTIPDIIWLKDKDGVYLSCNSMFERFFGAREADIVGKTDYDFIDRELADLFRGHDREAVTAGKPISKEDWITFADDGHHALMEAIKTPMHDAQGTLIGVLGIGRDVTERKRAEEKIRQMAYHDSLTGLPNRKLFSDRLGIALPHAQRNQEKIGIAMLDLDNFKIVNDTLGHEVGDLLLQATAERLSAALRKGDTVARIGGDEFAVILPDLKVIEGEIQVAQKIVDGFRKPFLIDTHQLIVTTSIGIAVYPDDGTDEVMLLKKSDIAMYQAKQAGRNQYKLYNEA